MSCFHHHWTSAKIDYKRDVSPSNGTIFCLRNFYRHYHASDTDGMDFFAYKHFLQQLERKFFSRVERNAGNCFSFPCHPIERLGIEKQSHFGEHKARKELQKVAENTLRHFFESQKINQKEFEFLSSYIIFQHELAELSHAEQNLQNSELIRLKILQAQRKTLFDLWKKGEIDDILLTHLEGELDIAEVHVARADLK